MVQPCGHFTWAANYEGRRRRAGRSDTLPLTLLGHDYVCYYGHNFWFGNITWKFTGMFTRCCFNLYVLEDSNLTSFDQANFLFDQATHLFIGTSTNYFFSTHLGYDHYHLFAFRMMTRPELYSSRRSAEIIVILRLFARKELRKFV